MSIGSRVTRKWKLSEGVTETVRYHHDMEQAIPEGVNHKRLVSIVALANLIVNNTGYGSQVYDNEELCNLACSQHLLMTPESITKLFEDIQEMIQANPEIAV